MPIVIDPVMVAESGAVLLDDEARAAIVTELLPLATVITPNLPEARVLAASARPTRDATSRRCARRAPARARARRNVVITGGHRDEITDVFFDGDDDHTASPGERHPDGAAHGSGCTHSSALAAHLALGFSPLEAARAGADGSRPRRCATACAGSATGPGPVNVLGRRRPSADGRDGATNPPAATRT